MSSVHRGGHRFSPQVLYRHASIRTLFIGLPVTRCILGSVSGAAILWSNFLFVPLASGLSIGENAVAGRNVQDLLAVILF
jgi:hypothetical protein